MFLLLFDHRYLLRPESVGCVRHVEDFCSPCDGEFTVPLQSYDVLEIIRQLHRRSSELRAVLPRRSDALGLQTFSLTLPVRIDLAAAFFRKIKELENEVAHERPDIFLSRPRIKERYIEYGDIGLLLFRENLPFLRHLLVVTGQICEAGKIKHVAGLQLLQEFLNFLVLRLPVNENVLLRGPFLLHDEDAVILALFPVLSGFCSYVRSRNPVTFDFTCGFPDNQLSTLLRRCDTADFSCKENNDVPQIAMFFAIITSLYFHIFCLKQIYNYPRKFLSANKILFSLIYLEHQKDRNLSAINPG